MTAPDTAPRQALELLAARNALRRELRAASQSGSGVHWHERQRMQRELNELNAALDALDPAALRAQAEAEAGEHKRLSYALEHDRAHVARGVHSLQRVLEGYSWLTEGRGPYAHDDDRWRDEFGNALREIGEALEPLRRIGRDKTDCPTLWADIQAARNPRAQAEAEAGLREALRTLCDLQDNPPPPDQRGVLANIAWTNARAALAQAGGDGQ